MDHKNVLLQQFYYIWNGKGSMHAYDLKTCFTAPRWKLIPINTHVIELVNQITAKDHALMKVSKLKTSKKQTVIPAIKSQQTITPADIKN
jgi:hypothetical protein